MRLVPVALLLFKGEKKPRIMEIALCNPNIRRINNKRRGMIDELIETFDIGVLRGFLVLDSKTGDLYVFQFKG